MSRATLSSRRLVVWYVVRPCVRRGPSLEPRVVAGSVGLDEVDLVLDRIDVHHQLRHVDAVALGLPLVAFTSELSPIVSASMSSTTSSCGSSVCAS